MYKIVEKRPLSRNITLMQIEAPLVAKKAEPGQFVILRATKDGERIPLTISGTDIQRRPSRQADRAERTQKGLCRRRRRRLRHSYANRPEAA